LQITIDFRACGATNPERQPRDRERKEVKSERDNYLQVEQVIWAAKYTPPCHDIPLGGEGKSKETCQAVMTELENAPS
jgi:hypothetical protein